MMSVSCGTLGILQMVLNVLLSLLVIIMKQLSLAVMDPMIIKHVNGTVK